MSVPCNKCTVTTKQWVRLSDDEADEYNKSSVVQCKICETYSNRLHFVHDKENCGDYLCPKEREGCDKTGYLIYFCFKCKKSKKEDEEDE